MIYNKSNLNFQTFFEEFRSWLSLKMRQITGTGVRACTPTGTMSIAIMTPKSDNECTHWYCTSCFSPQNDTHRLVSNTRPFGRKSGVDANHTAPPSDCGESNREVFKRKIGWCKLKSLSKGHGVCFPFPHLLSFSLSHLFSVISFTR